MYEDPRATAIVAEHENQIIGFLIATVGVNMPFYDVKEYAMLHDLWVEPEFRNRGVGRDMVRAAAAHFRKMGFTQMRASVAAANEPGRKMLESVGFAIVTHDMLMDLKPAKQSTDKSSHSR
jgi:ribosomal protein S18 acetylase RimI-like enzyme